MGLKQVKISDLKFDRKNANNHTEKGNRLLEKSLSRLGCGRSVLLDKDNNIIAGNGVTEKCGEIGIDNVRIIETDGTELIAVKRTDISIDSKKGRELAIADNQTAKAGIDFNIDVIDELSDEYDVDLKKDWEIFVPDFELGELNLMDNAFASESNKLNFSMTFTFPAEMKQAFEKIDKKELEKALLERVNA